MTKLIAEKILKALKDITGKRPGDIQEETSKAIITTDQSGP